MTNKPNFVTKEHFVGLINSLQAQYQKDKDAAHKIGQIFNSESPGPYDNTILIDAIVSCLRKYFPQEDGHCEIMHYCYEMNFGKNGDDYESPEELYDRLILSHIPVDAEVIEIVGKKIEWAEGQQKTAGGVENQFLVDEIGQWPGHKYGSHFIKHPIIQIEGIIKKVKHLFNQGVPSIGTVNALLDSTDYYIHVLKEGAGIKANNEG